MRDKKTSMNMKNPFPLSNMHKSSKENLIAHVIFQKATIDTWYAKHGFPPPIQTKLSNHTSIGGNDQDLEVFSHIN